MANCSGVSGVGCTLLAFEIGSGHWKRPVAECFVSALAERRFHTAIFRNECLLVHDTTLGPGARRLHSRWRVAERRCSSRKGVRRPDRVRTTPSTLRLARSRLERATVGTSRSCDEACIETMRRCIVVKSGWRARVSFSTTRLDLLVAIMPPSGRRDGGQLIRDSRTSLRF